MEDNTSQNNVNPSDDSVTDTPNEIDDLVNELKRHPAFMTEFDPSQEMSPEMEGLQVLKYESDSLEDNASSYKDDGNYNFKLKKYRWAIDNYTKAINLKCTNSELNADLYGNRSAANFRLKNFRSAFTDSHAALKLNPNHLKAAIRGAECLLKLKKFKEGLVWCDEHLKIFQQNESILKFKQEMKKLQSEKERDERKKRKEKEKIVSEKRLVLEKISEKGIKLAELKSYKSLSDEDIMNLFERFTQEHKLPVVHLKNNSELFWPIIFLYPEYRQTDFIDKSSENFCLMDHLEQIFENPVEWDVENKYNAQSIKVYFENISEEKLYRVDKEKPLKEVLVNKKLILRYATPTFLLLVSKSSFEQSFLERYKFIE